MKPQDSDNYFQYITTTNFEKDKDNNRNKQEEKNLFN